MVHCKHEFNKINLSTVRFRIGTLVTVGFSIGVQFKVRVTIQVTIPVKNIVLEAKDVA